MAADFGHRSLAPPFPESVTGTARCLSRRVRGVASATRNDATIGPANVPKADKAHLEHLALGPHTEMAAT